MDKVAMIKELKSDIDGLLKIKEQLVRDYGENHENVHLIDKSIEAMKTEALTKLHIDSLKESVQNKRWQEWAFDAEEIIDFLENIFDEDSRNFTIVDGDTNSYEIERDM